MSRAVLVAVALVVAVGGPLAAFVLAGDGDGGASAGRAAFTWEGAPLPVEPEPGLPNDSIVVGELRNTALREARLDADRVKVVDASGRPLKTSVRFSHAFAHGIYSAEMVFRNGPPPDAERRRLGEIATVRPGATVPLTIAWRGDGAEAIDLGGARVDLP